MADNVIAKVWSFSDALQKIPYTIETDSRGHMICSCPSSRLRKQTCKHISTLVEQCRNGTILTNEQYRITDYGIRFLAGYMKK